MQSLKKIHAWAQMKVPLSFGIVFTIQPVSSNHLKCKAAYNGTEVGMFYTRYTDINGMHVI